MSVFGNPLAFGLGGAPSDQNQAYDALKVAVGEGNSTPGTDIQASMMESWRYAKARGLAAATEDSRALAQNWPNSATDMIPMFEDLLGLGFPATTSEQEKRDALTQAYTRLLTAVLPDLTILLQAIDPTITVVVPDRDLTREVQNGRMYQDWDPTAPGAAGPPFNLAPSSAAGATASGFPNYSDDFVFLVWFPLLAGAPVTETFLRKREEVFQLMYEAMPAWCDTVVYSTGSGAGGDPCGFILDTDRLDLTVFCA